MFSLANLFSIISFLYLLITRDTQDKGKARFDSTSTGNSLKSFYDLRISQDSQTDHWIQW